MENKEKCEGIRGTNRCNRNAEFLVAERYGSDGEFKYSCIDCVGRIILEGDFNSAEVERLYE